VSKFKPIVLQSDFGLKDGAIAAMKGVIFGINPEISVYDNTHAIPPFSI
jgi:S-adenosylmethionine hydrolase